MIDLRHNPLWSNSKVRSFVDWKPRHPRMQKYLFLVLYESVVIQSFQVHLRKYGYPGQRYFAYTLCTVPLPYKETSGYLYPCYMTNTSVLNSYY